MNFKIFEITKFDLNRILSLVLLISVIPISLILLLFLFLYTTTFGGGSFSNNNYNNFLLATKMYSFLLQFVLSLYAISIGIYLFNDPSITFLISVSNSRIIPQISKYISVIVSLIGLNIIYLVLYVIFCSVFFGLFPPLEILLIIIAITFIESLCFTSLTYLGYTIFQYLDFNPLISSVFPISLLFILPHFIYSATSFGLFPVFIYSFTFQYNLSTIANYLLPSPFVNTLSTGNILSSFIIIISSIISATLIGFFLSNKFEYN